MDSRGRAADRHVPVLRDRILDLLAPALTEPGAVYVDAHPGHGRPRRGRPERCPDARLVGIDRDQEALALAGERLAPFGDRVTLVHAVYDEFADVVARPRPAGRSHAVLFDLGVSSLQLDEADRGLRLPPRRAAGHADGPDRGPHRGRRPQHLRRRRPRRGSCASTARSGSPRRSPLPSSGSATQEPFTTSARLVELLSDAIPAASQKSGGHPAKRTFQALRIEVNAELAAWATRPAGRDRRRSPSAAGSRSCATTPSRTASPSASSPRARAAARPHGLPVELPEHAAYLRLLTRGAEEPSAQEQARQPPIRLGPPAGRRTYSLHEGTAPMSQSTATAESRITGPPAPRRHRPAPAGRPGARAGHPGSGLFAALCIAAAGRRPDRAAHAQHLDGRGVVRAARPPGHLR